MKYLLLGLLYSSYTLAVIVPGKSFNWPVQVYQKPIHEYESGTLMVTGVHYNQHTQEYTRRQRMHIKKELLEKYQEMAQPVAKTYHNNVSLESAVHLGKGIMLTNHHTVFRSVKDYDKCGTLTMSFPSISKKKISCSQVLECSPTKEADWCFVQLEESEDISFEDLPVVKPHYHIDYSDEAIHYAIGNTLGAGIAGSKGKGLEKVKSASGNPNLKFHAAVFGGNSGGAVFDDQNRFIGLTRAMKGSLIGKDGYNMAIPLSEIKEKIEYYTNDSYDPTKRLGSTARESAGNLGDMERELYQEVDEHLEEYSPKSKHHGSLTN